MATAALGPADVAADGSAGWREKRETSASAYQLAGALGNGDLRSEFFCRYLAHWIRDKYKWTDDFGRRADAPIVPSLDPRTWASLHQVAVELIAPALTRWRHHSWPPNAI